MKKFIFTMLSVLFLSSISVSAPLIGFGELLRQTEENPALTKNARAEAMRLGIPVSILSTEGIFAEVKSLENGAPVYSVITNFANIYDGGFTAFHFELRERIDFSRSKITYANGTVTDYTGGFFTPKLGDSRGILTALMVTDWTNDRVYLFNSANGDLIDTAFIPRSAPQLASPKHALPFYNSKEILVSDQISDVVQRFNPNGSYSNVFAPIGGPITSILDNIRGQRYRANNNLLVTVGSGANQNTVQQFDPTGVHLGSFMSTGLNSPFDVLIRSSEILVSNFSGTNRVSRFDTSGVFISSFYTGSLIAGPQQLLELPNNDLIVAAFSPPSGLAYFRTDGTFVKLMNGVTGCRSAYLLGNGNYMTTNGTGVHEIDSASGGLVRTIITGANFQYVSELPLSDPELRVNIGFEAITTLQDTITVELRNSTSPYGLVESQRVVAGMGDPAVVTFSTAVSGTPYYVVVKHRNSIETWSSATPSFVANYMRYYFTYGLGQAYNSNMVVANGLPSIYTGDVNQDGIVDATDAGLIDNDAFNFVSGYVNTDLNYDDIVDASDASYADNNAFNFVGVERPM